VIRNSFNSHNIQYLNITTSQFQVFATLPEIKLDGYTQTTVEDLSLLQPLVFQAPLNQNARNNLLISIQDVNDGAYDTAVFLRGETLGTTEPSPILPNDGGTGGGGNGNNNGGNGTGGETTIPEPSTVLGIIVFSISSICGWTRRRKKV
jgi:hypothetical protein